MREKSVIHVFSKSNCNFCTRAKHVLKQAGLSYIEHDVEQSSAMAAASTYYSGRLTVPQVFIGNQHINGAEDLEALHAAGSLQTLVAQAEGELVLDPSLEETWVKGAEDFTLAEHLDKVDISKLIDDQEILLISHFYKGLFGFTPITYLYLGIWPEAFKACALNNVISTMPMLAGKYGFEGTFALTYAASSAQGCAYCTVHTAATTGVEQTGFIKSMEEARAGTPGPDNLFGELEVAMFDLVQQATLNKVTQDQLQKVRELAQAASKDPEEAVEGAGLSAQIMGLLNIFNDILNVELEGGMAALAEQELGLTSERHATTDSDPDDLNFELPEPELTVEDALVQRAEQVGDWSALAYEALGYVPEWLSNWPEMVRPLFTGAYTELMAESDVSAELKQLMARTSAIAKGHEALAASSAISAHHAAADKENAVERIQKCFEVATGQSDSAIFSPAEKLALRLAWLSAQTPIATPAQFVEPLFEHFSQRQIVELSVACGMACTVQRMAAAMQLKIGADEAAFCKQHGIPTDGLTLKYPVTGA